MKASEYHQLCVIDDEIEVLAGFCDNLNKIAPTRGFTSAVDALKEIKEGYHPAVTIVDLKMPSMDGLEFIEKAKKVDPKQIFVLATGHAKKDDLARAINAGATGYLEKPFTTKELKATISALMERVTPTKDGTNLEILYGEISQLYIDWVVLVENTHFRANNNFAFTDDEKLFYLQLKSKIHKLHNKIDEIKKLAKDPLAKKALPNR